MLEEILRGMVAQTEGGGIAGMLLPMVAIFAVMYFIIIRPQAKQQKAHQTFLSQLKKGDEVVTQSGLFGRIFHVGDAEVTLEVAPNVKLRVLKNAVSAPAPVAGATRTDEKKS